MFCSRCGNQLVIGSKFCDECGNQVEFNSTQNSSPNENAIIGEDLKLFIGGKKQSYYMTKWKKFKEPGNNGISWNWAAFFLNFFWLAYRKMYIHAIVVGVIYFIIGEVLSENLTSLSGLILGVVFGLFGNKIYYDYSKKEIHKIKSNCRDTSKQKREILNKGGTSTKMAILFAAIYLVIVFTWVIMMINQYGYY